jgi:hypothetical protein
MQSHTEADAVLTGRCKDRRKVANNTWLERHDNGDIAVRLHATDVVVYHPDESVTLNTGGWYSVTTKERMNRFTDFSVHSVKGEWYVNIRNPDYVYLAYDPDNSPNPAQQPYWSEPATPYADSMTWHGDHWTGAPGPDEVKVERARRKALTKEIKAFVSGITAEQIVDQFEDPGGDCFVCRCGQTSCLLSHVDERYFHAALARNAIAAKGYRSPDVIMSMAYGDAKRGKVDDLLTRSLTSFLKKNLIEGVATK